NRGLKHPGYVKPPGSRADSSPDRIRWGIPGDPRPRSDAARISPFERPIRIQPGASSFALRATADRKAPRLRRATVEVGLIHRPTGYGGESPAIR
ncbi:MAG: hypothetical protein JJT96_06280, partial [Opitutales bacterium]|nr:hypothetical protein [Opitutales bacterium]